MIGSLSLQQIGDRLAWARKRAELTQAQVAEQVGFARTTLVAIEKGERRPSGTEMLALARAIGVDMNDLLRPGLVRTSAGPRLRGGMDETEAAAVMRIVERIRELGGWYVELENLLGVRRAVPPLASLSTYRDGEHDPGDPRREGEDAARSVRAILGLGDEPMRDLDGRLEAGAGFRIFLLDGLPASVAACAIWSDEMGPCVAVRCDQSRERQRWALACELGHFLRDRDGGHVLEEGDGSRREAFADAFARELLLPAIGVQRRFAEMCRVGPFTPARLRALSRVFATTFQAMALRLEELKLLPRGTYDRIARHGVARRGDDPGAVDDAIDRLGLPARYVELAVTAYDQALLSENELARFLGTDLVTARAVYQASELPLDDGMHLGVEHAVANLRTGPT